MLFDKQIISITALGALVLVKRKQNQQKQHMQQHAQWYKQMQIRNTQ